MYIKQLKDLTVAEVSRMGMAGGGGPEFLTLVEAALKVGKANGYTEEQIRDMTMEEIFGPGEDE